MNKKYKSYKYNYRNLNRIIINPNSKLIINNKLIKSLKNSQIKWEKNYKKI